MRTDIEALYVRMTDIAEKYDLSYSDYSCYERAPYFQIESAAHELAHAVVLGLDLSKGDVSARVDNAHTGMDVTKSDRKEYIACAVEYLGLLSLGWKINLKRLTYDAARMMKTDRYRAGKNVYAMTLRQLERREVKRLARRFVRLVKE